MSELSHNEQPKELNEEDATTKKSDQINLLTSKYGTKKANRKVRSYIFQCEAAEMCAMSL